MNKDKQTAAADALEELLPAMKEIVIQLRKGVSDPLAYALLYRVRREVGYAVAGLGFGVPTTVYDRQAEDFIEALKLQPKEG